MADRLATISMDTGASIQVHASFDHGTVKDVTAYLDNDVNHWLKAFHDVPQVITGPALTPRILIIARQDSARRHSAVQGLVIPSTLRRLCCSNILTQRQDIAGRTRTYRYLIFSLTRYGLVILNMIPLC